MKIIPNYNIISGTVDSLIIDKDEKRLNWVDGKVSFGTPFGSFYTDKVENTSKGIIVTYELYQENLTLKVERQIIGDKYRETYTFTNNDEHKEVEIEEDKLGIYTPFNDSYDIAAVSLNRRCNAHIWCGGNCTYIYGLRMNGKPNNLGLVLLQGSINKYGVERKWNSNDRGDFILYLPKFTLKPHESYVIEWEIFNFIDKDDFFVKASEYSSFINLTSDHYSVSIGEVATLKSDKPIDEITIENKHYSIEKHDKGSLVKLSFDEEGEAKAIINYGKGLTTYVYFNIYASVMDHIDKRINFIIDNQQIKDSNSKYYGAYVLYDNEEDESFVIAGVLSNKNAGRERAGMYNLMISRLQRGVTDKAFKGKIQDSLKLAIDFIDRELVRDDGFVADDIGYKKAFWFIHRKYNYNWYATIYTNMYELTKEKRYLTKAINIIKRYYSLKGEKFYAIGCPIVKIMKLVEKNAPDSVEELKCLFIKHGDTLLELGNDIPSHEVKYEQSIIAPAAHILLSCYMITEDDKYLEGAKTFIEYLDSMNGRQPDYHMNDISIRHWDGYWFGKRKMYGDTFPHHWSCLTAEVFSMYATITNDKTYQSRANNILRNNLCLIDEDGRGSCAFVYPHYINGKEGHFYDEYANDQDWALFYSLEYLS